MDVKVPPFDLRHDLNPNGIELPPLLNLMDCADPLEFQTLCQRLVDPSNQRDLSADLKKCRNCY